jgi:hypothetical protein
MPASAPKARTSTRVIACDLGVTGKRLRRALPPVTPTPEFRAWLQSQLQQATKVRRHT